MRVQFGLEYACSRNEQLLTNLVGLSHGELEATAVLAVVHAELCILIGLPSAGGQELFP